MSDQAISVLITVINPDAENAETPDEIVARMRRAVERTGREVIDARVMPEEYLPTKEEG